MSLTVQDSLIQTGITQDKVDAVVKDISYISELADLGLTQGEVSNSFYLPKKTIHEVSLTMKDGGAKIVGLEDTMLQQANAILEQQDITLSPFAIQLEENMIIAPEYKVAEKLAPEMFSFLAAQKDSISWSILKQKSQTLPDIKISPSAFANAIMSVTDTMKVNLGTNQANWVMLISDNLVRKLYTTFNSSGINLGKQIFESLAANNILLKRHTQEDNKILLMDRKLCKHYKGDAVAGRAPYTKNQESITASTVHEFYFTSDYFTKPKNKDYAIVLVHCELSEEEITQSLSAGVDLGKNNNLAKLEVVLKEQQKKLTEQEGLIKKLQDSLTELQKNNPA